MEEFAVAAQEARRRTPLTVRPAPRSTASSIVRVAQPMQAASRIQY
jgi:hypothetical protein